MCTRGCMIYYESSTKFINRDADTTGNKFYNSIWSVLLLQWNRKPAVIYFNFRITQLFEFDAKCSLILTVILITGIFIFLVDR